MKKYTAQFGIGQIIHHKLFDYRGVIVDVDPVFQGTKDWYKNMALTKPPKDKPWYHVLVDSTQQVTYVAENNLESTLNMNPITHPELNYFFIAFKNGKYIPRQSAN